jgi:hypothetical protein
MAMRSLRSAWSVAALAALLGGVPARATVRDLEIRADQSTIRVLPTSGVWLDLVAPVGPVFVPFASQAGGPSTETSLAGWLRVEDSLDFSPPGFQIQAARTAIAPTPSGSWLPGLPASPGVAAPAPIAVQWSGFWLAGAAALRDVVVTSSASWSAEVVDPGERWSWPEPPFDGPFPRTGALHVRGGSLDVDVPLVPELRIGLHETLEAKLSLSDASRGQIRRFGGKLQLALPVRVSRELGPGDLETGLPVRVQLELAGNLVAEEPGYAPEPAAALQVAAAIATLAAVARRWS